MSGGQRRHRPPNQACRPAASVVGLEQVDAQQESIGRTSAFFKDPTKLVGTFTLPCQPSARKTSPRENFRHAAEFARDAWPTPATGTEALISVPFPG